MTLLIFFYDKAQIMNKLEFVKIEENDLWIIYYLL